MLQKVVGYFYGRAAVERVDISSSRLRNISADGLERYLFALNWVHGGSTLDIACGHGYGSDILSRKSEQVTGVDINIHAIKGARNKYSAPNVQFVCKDAILFLENNVRKFDNIICFDTIEHINDYPKLLEELAECLKGKGCFIVATPNKLLSDVYTGGTVNPFHVHEFYTEELEKLLSTYFKDLKHYIQRPVKVNTKGRVRYWDGVVSFLLGTPEIMTDNPNLVGIVDIFVCSNHIG